MATKITTKHIESYLKGLGKKDSKGKVLFNRILFDIKTSKTGVEIILDSPDTGVLLKNFKHEMIKKLMGKFKGSIEKEDKLVPRVGKVLRLMYDDNNKGTKYIEFDVREYPQHEKDNAGGVLKAQVSEPATRLILNAALESKGKIFKTQEDIFVHDVYKDLEKFFGKQWGHKLDGWIYTFLMQNKIFFQKYGRTTWAKFKHKDYKNEKDMQVFFNNHLETLEQAPGVQNTRNYEQWNPADIWAVKRSEQGTLEKEITEVNKNPNANNLMKLNSHLIKLLEDKELVGISLKKIDPGGGSFKIFNVDSSKALTNLKAWKPLTTFKMNDIRLELRNVFENNPGNKGRGKAATNYIYYGGKQFKISVSRNSYGALIFKTQIPSEPGAQGGNSVISAVLKALNHGASGVTFRNKWQDYPTTADEVAEIAKNPKSDEYKLYKRWFNFVYKHSKNDYKQKVTFDDYLKHLIEAYKSLSKSGIAKLALLNFWYDALKNHDKDPEFWTDLLYFGLKITVKGDFGPHVKIS
tara:strand:- start:143 stop:1705 length:1563 start_codon:yes stop_codon:yes gene_type:complete